MDRKPPRTHAIRACDLCRRRKIRCRPREKGESQQCRLCLEKGISCTYELPVRKRGPPGRNPDTVPETEDDLRPERDLSSSEPCLIVAQQSSGQTIATTPHTPNRGFNSRINNPPSPSALFSEVLLEDMIQDFLRWVYPRFPVVHIPSLRADLQSKRHVGDTTFHCLLLSLCCFVVTMLSRRFDHFRSTDSSFARSFTSRHQMMEAAHHLIRTMQKPEDRKSVV